MNDEHAADRDMFNIDWWTSDRDVIDVLQPF
jgi:hypothetical protein